MQACATCKRQHGTFCCLSACMTFKNSGTCIWQRAHAPATAPRRYPSSLAGLASRARSPQRPPGLGQLAPDQRDRPAAAAACSPTAAAHAVSRRCKSTILQNCSAARLCDIPSLRGLDEAVLQQSRKLFQALGSVVGAQTKSSGIL